MFYMQNQTLKILFQVYFIEHNQTEKKNVFLLVKYFQYFTLEKHFTSCQTQPKSLRESPSSKMDSLHESLTPKKD